MNVTTQPIVTRVGILLASLFAFAIPIGADENDRFLLEVPGSVHETSWWDDFQDPTLTRLIDDGLAANPDLAIAQSRMDQARALAWQNLSPVLPQVSVEMTGRQTAIETLGSSAIDQMKNAGENVPDSYLTGSAMLVGRLDLDLFGKRTLGYIGAKRDAAASAHESDAQAMSLTVMIAQTYYDILAWRKQIQAVHKQIQANENLLKLVQIRYERGDADGLDVLQQKQQLATTATLLPQSEAARETAEQQLAVLLGRRPGEKLEVPDRELPKPVQKTPTGRPSDLFRLRPDLLAVDLSLRAKQAYKTSAILQFFPSVQLYAQAGEQVKYINENDQEFVWEIGATISVPLFQGGSNVANYRIARAQERAAKQEKRQAKLRAEQEVENALLLQEQARRQLKAYNNQFESAALALQQSKSRYVSGLANYQTVLTALTTRQQAELNVIRAERAVLNARIALLDSLSGSWAENLGKPSGGNDK